MSDQWIDSQGRLFNRVHGLGASDLAAVLGYDPYTTPYDVWALKTGRISPPDENPAMKAGKRHQPTVLAYYNDTPGRDAALHDVPVMYSIAGPLLWATPDAIDDSQGRLVELKTTEIWNKDDWTDDAPIRHRVQCNIQRYAMGHSGVWMDDTIVLAVLIGLSDYREYEVPYDADWARDCIAYAKEWWFRHVVGDVPPDVTPRDIETFRKLHPEDTGEVMEADEELAEMIEILDLVRQDMADARRREQELKRKIEARVQDATYVRTGTGALRMGWKERAGYVVQPSRWREFKILDQEKAKKELGE